MNKLLKVLVPTLLAAGITAAQAGTLNAPVGKQEAANQWRAEGLLKTRIRGLDLAYLRPGTDLSLYRKVLVRPVSVHFQNERDIIDPKPTGTRINRTDATDVQRIRDRLAWAVRDEVTNELRRGGYETVTAPGPDVLEIDLQVADLHLSAPYQRDAEFLTVYTRRTGDMTLIAELRDVSGRAVMRTLDRSSGRDIGFFRLTSQVSKNSDLRLAANSWARALRHELDGTRRTLGQR